MEYRLAGFRRWRRITLGGALLSLAGSVPFALTIVVDSSLAATSTYISFALTLVVAFVLLYSFWASRSASVVVNGEAIHIRFGALLYLRLRLSEIQHFVGPVPLAKELFAPRIIYPVGTLLLGSGGDGVVLRLARPRRVAMWPFFPPGMVLRAVLVPEDATGLIAGLEQAGIDRIDLGENSPLRGN